MYGYVYKTTNIINGKMYIGQHKSEKFDESYKGSGVILTKALEKYGKKEEEYTFLSKGYSKINPKV